MKNVTHVVGARPNFMKIAPIMKALGGAAGIRQCLVNTGQHYDEAMAGGFLRDLHLPTPDRNLGIGSGTHGAQTAKIMAAFEDVCLDDRPDLVVVVGDVNSTMAATLVAAKLHIPVAHVEAGLRSFDRTMPEEINRIVTDRVADLLLTPSADADDNLIAEGVPPSRIHRVGNVMIDTLLQFLPAARKERIRDRLPIVDRDYAVMTLHRPSNVDVPGALSGILDVVGEISRRLPVVFPVHPRTHARLATFGLLTGHDQLILIEPLGYIDFLSLTSNARLILTDSGGLQEESTALGIPCLTLRDSTERPITVTEGTNEVVGTGRVAVLAGFERAMAVNGRVARRPALWDGHAAERVASVVQRALAG
jgi:UDP-N-acetylglucosamine 2-epimerase (non-hydrolysing)